MVCHERREAFGKRVRRDIEVAGYQQQEVAERIGMTRQQLNRILRGDSGTKPEIIESLACLLNAPAEEYLGLFFGTQSLAADVELTRILYSVPPERQAALIEAFRAMARAVAA